MSHYYAEPADLTQEAICVRIYGGQQRPVAMLNRVGPVADGAEFLFVPEGAFPGRLNSLWQKRLLNAADAQFSSGSTVLMGMINGARLQVRSARPF